MAGIGSAVMVLNCHDNHPPGLSQRHALTIAAGLTPAAQLAAQPVRYPPALDRPARPARGLV